MFVFNVLTTATLTWKSHMITNVELGIEIYLLIISVPLYNQTNHLCSEKLEYLELIRAHQKR